VVGASSINTIIRTVEQPPFNNPTNVLANLMQQNNTNTNINNFLTESRVHSSEMRINLTKLETKIDRVLDKIDLLKGGNSKTGDEKDDEILQLEEKLIEVRKENRALKQQVKGLEEGASAKATKDLLKQEDEEALAVLTVQVTESRRTIEIYQKERETKNKEIGELKAKIEIQQRELEQAKAEATKHNDANKSKENSVPSAELIRGIMNEFYQKLHKSVNEQNTWSKQEVLKLSVELIRNETKAALSRQN